MSRYPVVGRRLLAGRCVSGGHPLPAGGVAGRRSVPSRPAISTCSPSSIPRPPWPRRRSPTSRQPFGGVPVGIKELDLVEGWPDTACVDGLQGPCRHPHGRSGRAVHRRRCRPRGPHHRIGVRGTQRQRHQAQRSRAQPLAARSHRRRVVERQRGGRRRRAGVDRVLAATGAARSAFRRVLRVARHEGYLRHGLPRGPRRSSDRARWCSVRWPDRCATLLGTSTCARVSTRSDPWSLPNPGNWEAGLGSTDLSGKRVAVVPAFAGVKLEPGVDDRIRTSARELIAADGMVEVDVPLQLPNLAAQWAFGNLSTLLVELGTAWPACGPLLTDEIAIGLQVGRVAVQPRTSPAVAESNASRPTRRWQRRSIRSTSSSRPRTPGRRSPPRRRPRARVRRSWIAPRTVPPPARRSVA